MKPEHLEESHANTGMPCKLHTEDPMPISGIKPGAFSPLCVKSGITKIRTALSPESNVRSKSWFFQL